MNSHQAPELDKQNCAPGSVPQMSDPRSDPAAAQDGDNRTTLFENGDISKGPANAARGVCMALLGPNLSGLRKH